MSNGAGFCRDRSAALCPASLSFKSQTYSGVACGLSGALVTRSQCRDVSDKCTHTDPHAQPDPEPYAVPYAQPDPGSDPSTLSGADRTRRCPPCPLRRDAAPQPQPSPKPTPVPTPAPTPNPTPGTVRVHSVRGY